MSDDYGPESMHREEYLDGIREEHKIAEHEAEKPGMSEPISAIDHLVIIAQAIFKKFYFENSEPHPFIKFDEEEALAAIKTRDAAIIAQSRADDAKTIKELREALKDVCDGNDLAMERGESLYSWKGSDFERHAREALAKGKE